MRHRVEKTVDCVARNDISLGERSEADGFSACGKIFQPRRVWNVVPCHVLLDFILRYPGLIYLDLNRSCGIRYLFNQMIQSFRREILNYLVAESVIANGADHTARHAELTYMIGEIGRCASYFLPFGEHIP